MFILFLQSTPSITPTQGIVKKKEKNHQST